MEIYAGAKALILNPRKQMPPLASSNICDICNKPRSFGHNTYKHTKCSKIRQARYAALRGEK